MSDVLRRMKDAAKQGRLGEEINREIRTQAHKVTGFVDNTTTPGGRDISTRAVSHAFDFMKPDSMTGKQRIQRAVDDAKSLAKGATEMGKEAVRKIKKTVSRSTSRR